MKSNPYYLKLENKLRSDIRKNGFIQDDKRLKRKVWALPGHFIVLKDPKLLDYLKNQSTLDKYAADLARMNNSLQSAVKLAKKDKDSRQLMVFNDEDYNNIHQCFTHCQFVMTKRGDFDLYVYQRSADLSKLFDDLVFFCFVAMLFASKVNIDVSKIVVIYGSVHYTKE